ncbi:hypothetical protein P8452_41794 [Trifolium repens]|nr:hypothetical protein P8452_41794 [Trifolium repens]
MGYSEELTNIDHYVIQVDHNVVPVLTFDALPENKDLGFQAQPFGQFTFHNKAILVIMTCSKEGEEYPLLESCLLRLFEIWRKLLRWSFRKALLGMELIHHSNSEE